jgi:hypothetical protein
MLGLIGFLALAFVIGIYVNTCYTNYVLVPLREKRLFVSGYGFLGLASVIWAATFFVGEQTVSQLVFTSDVLLVAATGCMLGIFFDIARPRILAPLVLAGAGILTVRAFVVPPSAYVADDLLIFNLSQVEALVFGLVFLIAWLPATIKVVHLALRSPRLLPFSNVVSFIFISVVLMTGFFLTARRPIMIISSFASIILLFTLLAGMNVALKRIDKAHGKQKVQHG